MLSLAGYLFGAFKTGINKEKGKFGQWSEKKSRIILFFVVSLKVLRFTMIHKPNYLGIESRRRLMRVMGTNDVFSAGQRHSLGHLFGRNDLETLGLNAYLFAGSSISSCLYNISDRSKCDLSIQGPNWFQGWYKYRYFKNYNWYISNISGDIFSSLAYPLPYCKVYGLIRQLIKAVKGLCMIDNIAKIISSLKLYTKIQVWQFYQFQVYYAAGYACTTPCTKDSLYAAWWTLGANITSYHEKKATW